MEAPTKFTHFKHNQQDNNPNQLEINNNNELKSNQEEFPNNDEQESNLNNNIDNDNNVVIIESPSDSPKKRNTIKDFQMSYLLGKGSYAKVVLATNIYTNKQYALKIIDKLFLAKVMYHYKFYYIT
jgi:hypothetical protein